MGCGSEVEGEALRCVEHVGHVVAKVLVRQRATWDGAGSSGSVPWWFWRTGLKARVIGLWTGKLGSSNTRVVFFIPASDIAAMVEPNARAQMPQDGSNSSHFFDPMLEAV